MFFFDPYVSISIGERRGGMQLHMCQFSFGKRRGAYSAPYVSIYSSGNTAPYSSICVILSQGAARRMQLHMCQFLSGSGAAAYSSIYLVCRVVGCCAIFIFAFSNYLVFYVNALQQLLELNLLVFDK